MHRIGSFVSAGLVALAFNAVAMAETFAQEEWPQQPVEVIIPWAAGGATDAVARLLFTDLEEQLGQPFLLDFRPGAAGTIGAAYTATADPDGYTIMITSDSPLVTANFLPNVPYDPKTAFIPVAQLTYTPSFLAAHPSVPYDSFQELIEYAKANPAEVNAAFAGIGSAGHLNMSLIQHETGAELTTVPYPGSSAQLVDLLSGVVDIGSGFPTAYLPLVESGRLKFIAVMSDERSPIAPDVPTTDESDYKGIYGGGWFGVFVPNDTPREIVDRLNTALLTAVEKPEIADKINKLGYTIVTRSPDEFARKIEGQVATVKELIDSGMFKVE